MAMQLRWSASGSASCFYAVRRLAEGRESTLPEATAALVEPAAALARFLEAQSIAAAPFFDRLIPAAAAIESNRELARTTLTKLLGSSRAAALVEPLGGLLGDCERPYFQAFPQLMDELELRGGPLRELWEARGPGLLAGVAKRTDPRLVVDEAQVTLAQPCGGGGGLAHPAYNSVTFEAVLANPHAQLPETVRLAWLLSTLAADLPDFVEHLSPGTAQAVVSLAILPAVLEAAADVEWVRPEDGLLATAVAAWEVPTPAGGETPTIVNQWWTFTRSNKSPWNVALTALGRMLFER